MNQPAPNTLTDPAAGGIGTLAVETGPGRQRETAWRRLVPDSVRALAGRVAAAASARRDPSPLTVAYRHSPAFAVQVDVEARTLTVSGDMDMAAVGPFTVAAASLTIGRRGGVTVDLHALRFIDASGLGALVALNNILRRGGQTMTLRNAGPRIARIFDVGGLSDFVTAVS